MDYNSTSEAIQMKAYLINLFSDSDDTDSATSDVKDPINKQESKQISDEHDSESVNTESWETEEDTVVDNKVEMKDLAMSLVAEEAVKQAADLVDVNIGKKQETDESKVKAESVEDNENLEHENKHAADPLVAHIDETNDSLDKKEKEITEITTESAESSSPADDNTKDSEKSVSIGEETEGQSLVPLFCTPDKYMEFKAKVLQYHCLFFEEPNCDRQTQDGRWTVSCVQKCKGWGYIRTEASQFQ